RAHDMLRGKFPRVGRWDDTGDVLQEAMRRLCLALQDETPTSALGFFALATLQIRRALLDLARHHFGPHGGGPHHNSPAAIADSTPGGPPLDPPDQSGEPGLLAQWAEFHRSVEALPQDEREVFELLWYQDLTKPEAASVLNVSVKTVLRRYQK